MKHFFTNNKSSILLLCSIFLGVIAGIFLKEDAKLLKPIGDFFLNLVFMTMPVLIFFCISSTFASISRENGTRRILINALIVFLFSSLFLIVLTIATIYFFHPIENINIESFGKYIKPSSSNTEFSYITIYENLMNIFTVNDFSLILSKEHILPLILFSMLFGYGASKIKDKNNVVVKFLVTGKEAMLNTTKCIMKLAPLCLGCYFAYIVSSFGLDIFESYKNIFICYMVLSILVYFAIYPLFVYFSKGFSFLKEYFRCIIDPTLIAMSSCSSIVTLPSNLLCAKKLGLSDDVVDTVIPLGVNINKNGSIIGSVFKVAFLFAITGQPIFTLEHVILIFILSFIETVVLNAIPIGGFIGEMLIISTLGLQDELLSLVIIISTIIDCPATILNSIGNTAAAVVVDRLSLHKAAN